MSVDTRRFAAAQRTAAHRPGARRLRLASWLLIVPTLTLFSFSVVAGAAGFGTKPDYASAVKAVTPTAPPSSGGYVVVETAKKGDDPVARLFGTNPGREICWISSSQLARVSARYRTGRLAIPIGRTRLDVITVFGANTHDLGVLLASPVRCKLVEVAHVFFLPFDAHGS